ncbi:hypothetical protein [Kribbella sp. NPDC051770]|uniref:hypothetical protein n=1 Tax=Kribbella sp. NPDC051770 TaxID=3155413 RepID=UPI003434764A
MTHPTTEGWLDPEQVGPFIEHLSGWIGYAFDLTDWTAFEHGLPRTDLEDNRWFEYPLAGTPELTVRAAYDANSGHVTLELTGAIDPVLAARIETAFELLSRGPNRKWPLPLDL